MKTILKKIEKYIRIAFILSMAIIFYPCIYVFGFLMALTCSCSPHKTAIKCIDSFNGVFE